MPKYATVALDISVAKSFDYLIPRNLEDSVKPGLRVYVPFRSGRRLAYVIALSDGTAYPGAKAIISVRDREPVLSESMLRLAEWMASHYLCPLSKTIRCILPSSIRRGPGAKALLFVRPDLDKVAGETVVGELCRRAPKQALALKILLDCGRPMELRKLIKSARTTRSSIRSLEKKGLVTLFQQRVWRDPWEGETILPTEHLSPTREQERAIGYIKQTLRHRRFASILLHGITGSGKTEVYLQAIDEVLKHGRGAIVLVPEISLTPQTVEDFKARFSNIVAVLHSRLSLGERLDEWERLRGGKAQVVVGARSAIFAPIANLGLIVVDEEHERTYKQEEAPRYHARDVAVMRAKIERATVILGSATPSVESYWNAMRGDYKLFRLPRRIKDRRLPAVTIVDMKEEIKRSGRMTFFSRRLLNAIEERLEKGEQIILFLNRRGFSPVVMCSRCGYAQKCPNCSVSLTMHRDTDKMLCHLCGYEHKPFLRCPRCQSKNIRFLGLGTQKLEFIISKLFPESTVGRMDSDSMSGKGAHAQTLKAFKTGEIQILLGTQMIAKGLHFPNVTLVGVICADTALHLPDFRASENTFQLLTQVAGRAGRGDIPGEVIVQTFAPKHPAILAAKSQDYELFYRQEIPFREELGYPPVKRFILVTMRGRNEHAVSWFTGYYARLLNAEAGDTMEVLGPAPSPILRAKGYYRWQVICKGEEIGRMNELLRETADKVKSYKDVQIVVDVDPISML